MPSLTILNVHPILANTVKSNKTCQGPYLLNRLSDYKARTLQGYQVSGLQGHNAIEA